MLLVAQRNTQDNHMHMAMFGNWRNSRKRMRTIIFPLTLLFVSGCATTETLTYNPEFAGVETLATIHEKMPKDPSALDVIFGTSVIRIEGLWKKSGEPIIEPPENHWFDAPNKFDIVNVPAGQYLIQVFCDDSFAWRRQMFDVAIRSNKSYAFECKNANRPIKFEEFTPVK